MEKVSPSSTPWWALLLLGTLLSGRTVFALQISNAEAERIGRRIWHNECNGTVSGLTSWNAGENFASLGIGHFIWYPAGARGPFEESFPGFLAFARAQGAAVPALLEKDLPWHSRSEFESAKDSPVMRELRSFLTSTINLQAQFLVRRLELSRAKMLEATAHRAEVTTQFDRVAATAQGCYALVDYVNFKGEGTLATERYHGQGWGLLQVLEEMKGGNDARTGFADAAQVVLKRRVANAPPERREERWLPGWLNRVRSYRGT